MSEQPQESEGRAIWREFRETAWDLTRDITALPKRIILFQYDQFRNGFHGAYSPASPLTSAVKVLGMELAKCAGGAPVLATELFRNTGGSWGFPVAGTLGLVASNLVLNTVFARSFLLDGRPILPRHQARLAARAAANRPFQ